MCIVQKKVLLSLLICHLTLFSSPDKQLHKSSSTLNFQQYGMRQVFCGSDFISPDESPASTKTQISPLLKSCNEYLVGHEYDGDLEFQSLRLSGDFEESDSRNSSPQGVRLIGDFRDGSSSVDVITHDSLEKGTLSRSRRIIDILKLTPAPRGEKRSQESGDDTTLYKKAARDLGALTKSTLGDFQSTMTDDVLSDMVAITARRKVKVCVKPVILQRRRVKLPDEFILDKCAQPEAKE